MSDRRPKPAPQLIRVSVKRPSKRERKARKLNDEDLEKLHGSSGPPNLEDPLVEMAKIVDDYRKYFSREGMPLEHQVSFLLDFLSLSVLKERELTWRLEQAEKQVEHLQIFVSLQRLSDGMAEGLLSMEPFSPLVAQALSAAVKADRAQRARKIGAPTQKRFQGNKARAFEWLEEHPRLSIEKSKTGLKNTLHISDSTAERYVLEWRASRRT